MFDLTHLHPMIVHFPIALLSRIINRIQGEYDTNTLTIRLDEDILQKIDTYRGEVTRSEYIRVLLAIALEHKAEHKENTTEHNENTDLIEAMKGDIEHLRSQNVDLTKLLHQEQSLHLQTQRQLMPTPEEINKKTWWKFWKK